MAMEDKREPKRRNPAKTQARILDAAFELFSSQGYARTGMREVAERADVATSLVVRYFGTKAALFEQALVRAIYERGFFVRSKPNFGERMAALVVGDEEARIPAMMVLAIADPESREIAQKVTRDVVLKSLADWLGPPDAQNRALHMLTLMNGFTIQTRHLRTGDVPPESVRWLARSLQAIVDEEHAPAA
jgi:AcrR family transcriptional regulator